MRSLKKEACRFTHFAFHLNFKLTNVAREKICKFLYGKKAVSLLLLVCLSFGHSAFAYEIGDKIGDVLATDIVTYINGIKVPSFNIAGRTAVVVENLNAMTLPFGVNYDDSSRTLTIAGEDIFATGGRDYFHFDWGVSEERVGTPIMDVLYTDIRTVFGDAILESFNIGGFTCVYADDLAKLCGTYEWSEENRTVNINVHEETPSPVTVTQSERRLYAEPSAITKDETTHRWAAPRKSHIIKNDDGTFTVLEVDEHINLETYDSDFNHISSFAIKKELPIFGALYVGEKFNYIAFGQENLLEDPSCEVIKIVVYDKKFVKISEVSINNCKTAIPFDASGADMSEDERYLVLHTSRSGYRDENGVRPQTQLTVIIDKHTWRVTNMLGKFQYNHTSHALAGFTQVDDGKIITATLSDAAPLRAVFMQELDTSGKVIRTQSLFNIGGPLAANCTGTMIGGFEKSDSGYLAAISSIDHSLPTGYNNVSIEGINQENRDIYLLWTDKTTWEMRHTRLSHYSGAGLTGSAPYLVKLQDGNFMALWQQFDDFGNESNIVCYTIIDKDGNQIGETKSVLARLSDSCVPVDIGGKVAWYVNTDNGRRFYTLSTGDKKVLEEDEKKPSSEEGTSTKGDAVDSTETLEEEKNKFTEVEGI